MFKDLSDLLILNKAFYANPVALKYIMSHYSSLEALKADSENLLQQFRLSKKKYINDSLFHYDPKQDSDYLKKENIKLLSFQESNYPSRLLEISDAPPILFYKGNIACLKKDSIAIIGPRKATDYGKTVAKQFTKALARHFCICSGFAKGIDYIAHKTTCDQNKETIAVLGAGFATVYPTHYHSLSKDILNNNGLILTEVPLFAPSLPFHFRHRNRIISGLSKGVLICEAATKSGTLVTAQCALDQNRENFSVPGSIFSNESEGTLSLIQQGAKCTLKPKDIYDELNIFYPEDNSLFDQEPVQPALESNLSETEHIIVDILKTPHNIDDVVSASKLPLSQVLHSITMLELKNVITQKPGKLFHINAA